MEERLTQLFKEWHALGGAVLLADEAPSGPPRGPETVIGESTGHCRDSGRLTWVVLDWMNRHVEELDEQTLLQEARRLGDLSVLGVLCDAANAYQAHPRFQRIISSCRPATELTIFFRRVARSPLAARLTREGALDLFRRWNYLCNELRYLSAAPS